MIKHLIILLALLTVGCAGRDGYTQFRGSQQSWPTASGNPSRAQEQFPIYHSLPEKPYTIVGTVALPDISSAEHETSAINTAKKHRGEAVIIVDQGSELTSALRQAVKNPAPTSHPLTYKDSNIGFAFENKDGLAEQELLRFPPGNLAVIIRWLP